MKSRRRRRRVNFEFNPKFLWIFCIILCFGLMFVSYRFPERFSGVKTVAGNLISPMQRGINGIGRGISARLQAFGSVKKLRAENERLQAKIDELIVTNQQLTQDKYELDGLRRLYELDAKYMDYEKVAARVIASDTNNWFYSFIVDKGSEDGIVEGMNVMAGNGLVGIVSETGKNWARVRSVIDDNCNVSGMSIETQDTCIVSGDLKLMKEHGVIRVEMISMEASFKEDTEIVTSHISDQYLQGILIGYIQNIEVDSSNMTKTAYLIPAVDFERLDEVLIVTELKEVFDFK